jgi:GxxExxY protein
VPGLRIETILDRVCPARAGSYQNYKGLHLECGYRLDLLIEDRRVVELKSVDELLPIFDAQVLTYMKLANKSVGLLINFNVPVLKMGLRRFVR